MRFFVAGDQLFVVAGCVEDPGPDCRETARSLSLASETAASRYRGSNVA